MKTQSKPKFYRHLEGLKISAVFSDCGNYRYLLKIEKNTIKQGKHVCAVMLNPSVADEKQADKSVQFLEKLIFEKSSSYFKNVSTLSIINLFAFIQTRGFEGNPEQLGPENNHFIEAVIAASDIVLIAWGKTCGHPGRKSAVLQLLDRFPEKTILIANSHPSRGTYQNFVRPFEA